MPSETKEKPQPGAASIATTAMSLKHGSACPVGEPLPCPRCESRETKFCYYNNYNLSQPRYFCKGCRRYWTLGGTLRNVPIGGGSRKNSSKRPRTTKPPPTPPVASPPNSASSSSVTALAHEPEGPVKLEGLVNPEAANGIYAAPGGFGYGYGPGMYDTEIGFQSLLGAPAMGYFNLIGGHGSGGACPNTWQFLDDLGGEAGVGDSLAWPGLAISTPGDASSK